MSSQRTTITSHRVIRLHIKSRSGCLTCKKRRIKCDEVEPTCKNCYRRDIECLWKRKKHNLHTTSIVTLPKPLTTPSPITVDATSLRIIHHFTVGTSAFMCSNPSYTSTSAIAVPQLSFSNPFLLHALLACTSLHLGRLYPHDSQWLSLASAHRKAAITADGTSLDAKFMAAGFFSVYTFSSALHASLGNIFSLVTSLHNVWSRLEGFTYEDESLMNMDFERLSSSFHWDPQRFGSLHRIYDLTTTAHVDLEEIFDIEDCNAYREAVNALCVAYVHGSMGYEARSAVIWPALCGERFFGLLVKRRQRAIVVLYCYLVMLRDLCPGWWWMNDVGRCAGYVWGLLDVQWRDWFWGTPFEYREW